jgi:hypothetical protein
MIDQRQRTEANQLRTPAAVLQQTAATLPLT